MLAQGIGLGASILGGLIGRSEGIDNANAVAEARNQVLLQYLKKQRGLEDEGRGYLDKTVGTYAPGNTQLEDAQGARTSAIANAVGGMSDPNAVATSRSAPKNVRGEVAKRMLTAFQDSTTRAKAMGALGGYGDQWANNNVNIGDTGRKINTLQNFSRGNSAILQSQQDLAEVGATQAPSIWGTALQAGGKLLMGMNGGYGGAASTASGPNLGGGIWAGL